MKEELITFPTAVLAKEKGFDEKVIYHYFPTNPYQPMDDFHGRKLNNTELIKQCNEYVAVPTRSLLQRWLREKHNIEVEVYRTLKDEDGNKYGCQVIEWISDNSSNDEACNVYGREHHLVFETGLQEALKLI